MQVAPRNTVSLTQQDHALQGGMCGIPLEPHVSHVAFSSDGLVMATVDVRPNAGSLGSDEQSLRFWDRSQGGVTLGSSQEQPMYSMNTYLDDPHRYLVLTLHHEVLHCRLDQHSLISMLDCHARCQMPGSMISGCSFTCCVQWLQ